MPTRSLLKSFGCWMLLAAVAPLAMAHSLKIEVASGQYDRNDVPVTVVIEVPDDHADATVVKLTPKEGDALVGQLTKPGLMNETDNSKARELHFILPSLYADTTATFDVSFSKADSEGEKYQWIDEEGKHMDLKFGDRQVARYMYEALDTSSKERQSETFKIYHHLYDPTGEHQLTKGAGGLFPHHRGVFYGFNRVSYTSDGKKQTADVWHCNNGESQQHAEFVRLEAGPVVARQLLKVNWNGKDGKPFATELREITIFNTPDDVTLEFASKLTSDAENLKLDGDPQHAGFQFRATQHVPDKTKDKTYYVRPDGKGKPGQFRNWPGNEEHINLPWYALSFIAFDQQYTVCYLDRDDNPKPARFSERDYGRFGSYFEKEIPQGESLKVNYRLCVHAGALDVEDVEHHSLDFVSPPTTKVVK